MKLWRKQWFFFFYYCLNMQQQTITMQVWYHVGTMSLRDCHYHILLLWIKTFEVEPYGEVDGEILCAWVLVVRENLYYEVSWGCTKLCPQSLPVGHVGYWIRPRTRWQELVNQIILLVLLASGIRFSFKILQPFITGSVRGGREKLHDSGSYLN